MSHNLPLPLTSFVGRDSEIAEITALLANPACRLLTLVGVGGVGKTRLAIEAAAKMAARFAHGNYFVPLQPVSSLEFLVAAVASALKLPLSGQSDPWLQLLSYLHNKRLLLVLDNFEHLVAEAGLLSDILRQAPAVHLLVTSREVLNLQEEWLYPVHGLTVPPRDLAADLEVYTAVRLFAERARRVRPDFSLEDEGAAVAEICRLVEGAPLALELAAPWTRMLTCAEIATEIRRNVDFLATSVRNVPARHRSMRAVFEQSWQFLMAEERSAFMRLSVFHGGFDAAAAAAVAGASLAVLAVLTGKSLLHRQANGRYQIHELLRQYATERLAQSPEEVAVVRDLHCAYYVEFLRHRRDDIIISRQREAALEVEADLDNIRAAWQWAVTHVKAEALQAASPALAMFYQIQSRYVEGTQALEWAAQRLASCGEMTQQVELALVTIFPDLAWFYVRVGRLEEVEAITHRCRELYNHLGIPPVRGAATDPQLWLSVLGLIKGDYPTALRHAEQARALAEAHHHTSNVEVAWYCLAQVALAQGDYPQAQHYAQEAHRIAHQLHDQWFMAYCLNTLGDLARALGDYNAARQHYQASYTIRQEFDDAEGMAVALGLLGEVALKQRNYPEAQQLYQQARSIYEAINDKGGFATALLGLGRAACGVGDLPSARRNLREALQAAREMQFVPRMLRGLLDVGQLLLKSGETARGLALLALACDHPASDRETQDEARQQLDHYRRKLPAGAFAVAVQRGRESALDVVVDAVLAELVDPVGQADAPVAERKAGRSAPAQSIVEPLTPRELEVLRLIAAGLSNREIAAELVIAVGTVKRYTAEVFGKLGAHSRTQAVARARALKLLP